MSAPRPLSGSRTIRARNPAGTLVSSQGIVAGAVSYSGQAKPTTPKPLTPLGKTRPNTTPASILTHGSASYQDSPSNSRRDPIHTTRVLSRPGSSASTTMEVISPSLPAENSPMQMVPSDEEGEVINESLSSLEEEDSGHKFHRKPSISRTRADSIESEPSPAPAPSPQPTPAPPKRVSPSTSLATPHQSLEKDSGKANAEDSTSLPEKLATEERKSKTEESLKKEKASSRGASKHTVSVLSPTELMPRETTADTDASGVSNLSISTPSKIRLGKKEVLGKGSFGCVYRAIDLETNRLIAVKEIMVATGSGTMPDKQIADIRKEVSVMEKCNHRNIVKYLGQRREESSLLIFLEFVPGGSIAAVLKSFGALEERQVCQYTRHILEGIKYLHGLKTCHRDLKGDNLLVDVDGTLKLADFGTSRVLMTCHQAESNVGTPYFMAPEVIKGTGHGFAADVWSIGCCVLEMLLGKPPFTGRGNAYATMMYIANCDVNDEIPPSIPPLARSFILQCLQHDASKRPSAAELLQHDWITQTATKASPPTKVLSPEVPVGAVPSSASSTTAPKGSAGDAVAVPKVHSVPPVTESHNHSSTDAFNPMDSYSEM